MGKQKSFIIVGSTFLVFILLLLLMPVITSGLKSTKIGFESTSINVVLGKQRGIAPVIYAGGDIGEGIILDYEILEGEDVIDLGLGTYSSGVATKYTWSFYELDSEGQEVTKNSNIPYDEEDVISIKDGYWYVGDVNTGCAAEEEYAEEDIPLHAVRSEKTTSFVCFILNGIQTDIVYDRNVTPVRNEETKTWFINGKDTGYTYEGIQATITPLMVGSATIKCTGKVDGKDISATLRINVIEDDPITCNPTSVSNPYLDSTLIVKDGYEFDLEYVVNGTNPENPDDKPLQDITYTIKNDIVEIEAVTVQEEVNGVMVEKVVYKVKAKLPEEAISHTGSIELVVPKTSFKVGQEKNLKNTITIIVLNEEQTVIDKINEAREAIAAIGTVANTPECRELVQAARTKVNAVSTELQVHITNLTKLTNAEKRIDRWDNPTA